MLNRIEKSRENNFLELPTIFANSCSKQVCKGEKKIGRVNFEKTWVFLSDDMLLSERIKFLSSILSMNLSKYKLQGWIVF